jgi:fructoselysine-6-P-deglycase FrlB-like protein
MIGSDLESGKVSEIAREIASQPDCWHEAARRGRERSAVMPERGTRVGVIGCGTSLFVAQAYAALRESLGAGETDAFPASETPFDRPWSSVVAISRSGTTTEVVAALESLRETRRIALVGVDGSPVAETADEAISLAFADERSVVQTRFATSALALLRASLDVDLERAIEQAGSAVDGALPIDPASHEHFVFLGAGWTVGLANEAALKLREAAQAWTESYPAMEFRHGPISVTGPRSVVWAIGDVDRAVLEDAVATGATVVGGGLDPMAELMRIQRAAVELAEHRGLDPDRPRHLSRSVVLPVEGSDAQEGHERMYVRTTRGDR